MENHKILSFIIPAYNSEPFLKKCLESFCAKDVFDTVEVLIINDGSTDRTEKIGKQYVDKNGGHGSAINEGISYVTGKWFRIVDADDWLETIYLSQFVNILKNYSADVAISPFQTFDIRLGKYKKWEIIKETKEAPIAFEHILKDWNEVKNGFTLHGITYNTRFYRSKAPNLCEGVFYEDHEYATIPCCYAKRIIVIDLPLYVYRIGDVSQSIAVKNQLKRKNDLRIVLETMTQYYCQNYGRMTEHGQVFFLRKLESVLLSYYKILLLVVPKRSKGRKMAMELYLKTGEILPELQRQTKRKYQLLIFFNYIHVSLQQYMFFVNTRIYKWLRSI